MGAKPRVWFHRTWTRPNGGTGGGNLKVRDAFETVLNSDDFEAVLHFGPKTIWHDNPANVWWPYRAIGVRDWAPGKGDLIFFSGSDWLVLSEPDRDRPPCPVLNIVQPRHTRPADPRQAFLHHPAIRIAKSRPGLQILEAYGVNGPICLIPDSIDLHQLPPPIGNPVVDLLIVGLKQPELAQRLVSRLLDHPDVRDRKWVLDIQVPPALPTRLDFLDLLNRAKRVLFLPNDDQRGGEGFYLPALEAMAMGKLVICPDVVGNADYCLPGITCLQPQVYSEDALIASVEEALAMTESHQQSMIGKALAMAKNHNLEQERQALLNLLDQAYDIWSQTSLFRSLA